MNLKLSGVGAEPKKVAILAGLLLVAAYFYFSNRNSSTSASVATPPPTGAAPSVTTARPAGRQVPRANRAGQSRLRNADDLKPSLKPKRDEEVDRSRIDPTLHLELLAKLKDVKVEGTSRSLFEAGLAPAAVPKAAEPAKIIPTRLPIGPNPPPPPPPPPQEPKAPPVPLKFYGFVNQTKAGVKRAFFLDGDDIIVAAEGQMIKSRYKIVRIGINSAVVEDTQFKKNNQQTLPLVEEVPG
jgi:hypothetical protein